MSIDLFKTLLELRGNLVKDYHREKKNILKTLYDYHKLKEFINRNIIYGKNNMTYQLIYNFAIFTSTDILGQTIAHNINEKKDITLYDQWDRNTLNYFYISYTISGNPNIIYEYKIYPTTTPGEIKFDYTEDYLKKEIHESKTFINSLDMDPHKDNMYTSSARHFSAAKDKINEVINIFFKYYIDKCKLETIRSSKLLSFIWGKES